MNVENNNQPRLFMDGNPSIEVEEITIIEYVKSPFWFKDDSEKSFNLLRKTLARAIELSKFDELIEALQIANKSLVDSNKVLENLKNNDFCDFEVWPILFKPKQITDNLKSAFVVFTCFAKIELIQKVIVYLFNQQSPEDKVQNEDKIKDLLNSPFNIIIENPSEPKASEKEIPTEEAPQENETLLSFVNNEEALTQLDPESTIQLTNLLSETTDPNEFFAALDVIEHKMANASYWKAWYEKNYENEEMAIAMKRGLIMDRLKTILNETPEESL